MKRCVSVDGVASFVINGNNKATLTLLTRSMLFGSESNALTSLSESMVVAGSVVISSACTGILIVIPALTPSFNFGLSLINS